MKWITPVLAGLLTGIASSAYALASSCQDSLRYEMTPSDVKAACGEPPYAFSFAELTVDASPRFVVPPPLRSPRSPVPWIVPPLGPTYWDVRDAIDQLSDEINRLANELRRINERLERIDERLERLDEELYELQRQLTLPIVALISYVVEVWDYPDQGCTVALSGPSVASGLRVSRFTCAGQPLSDNPVLARERAYQLVFGNQPGQ